jgi:hypothetical protein
MISHIASACQANTKPIHINLPPLYTMLGITQLLTHPATLGNCIAICKVVYKEGKSGPKRQEPRSEEVPLKHRSAQ